MTDSDLFTLDFPTLEPSHGQHIVRTWCVSRVGKIVLWVYKLWATEQTKELSLFRKSKGNWTNCENWTHFYMHPNCDAKQMWTMEGKTDEQKFTTWFRGSQVSSILQCILTLEFAQPKNLISRNAQWIFMFFRWAAEACLYSYRLTVVCFDLNRPNYFRLSLRRFLFQLLIAPRMQDWTGGTCGQASKFVGSVQRVRTFANDSKQKAAFVLRFPVRTWAVKPRFFLTVWSLWILALVHVSGYGYIEPLCYHSINITN